MSRITMKDVARQAGVSQPTVSHVINGTASISGNVTRKVNKAIEQLGYLPNAAARSLKKNTSNIVGLIVPSVDMRFYGELVKVIERILRKEGYITFLCNTFYNGHLEKEYVETLIQNNVIGVISGSDIVDEKSYSLLINNDISTVLLDTQKKLEGMFSVQVDNELIARLAVSHLYDTGARKISYCSEPIATSMLQTRYECFKHAMKEFGLTLHKNQCFFAQNQFNNHSKIEMGYDVAANVLLQDDIDAVFASSDEFAYGIISRFKEHKIDIPGQIQIMGCDNDPFSSLITPSLTTLQQPISLMAEIGVDMLLRLINDQGLSERSKCLEPSIIIRESTKEISIGKS